MFRSEPNARIHAAAAVAVGGLCLWLRVPIAGVALVVFAVALVFTAEAINTSIEALSDRVSSETDPKIARAKDAAAGAVLFAAIGAAVVGFLVLGPPLWRVIAG